MKILGPQPKRGVLRGRSTRKAPGEVSDANSPDPSPSPGDTHHWAGLADSALMEAAANMIELQAGRRSGLAFELRSRAAQFSVFEAIGHQ